MSKGGGSNFQYIPMASSSTTNESKKTEIPAWLTNAAQYGINNAKGLLNQDLSYNNPMAAGLQQGQLDAGASIYANQGMAQPYYNSAATSFSNAQNPIEAATLANGLSGIGRYMNPYIDNVVANVNALSQNNLNQALSDQKDAAIKARAYGGSRQGVQEGAAIAQNNLATNNLLSNLLSQGYNNATNMLGTDVQAQNAVAQQNRTNALNAGQQMSALGTDARAAATADANNLLQYGGLQQNTIQNALDKQLALWQYQKSQPLQAQQVYNQAVSTAPHDTSSSGTASTNSLEMKPVQQQSSNFLQTAGGLAAMGLGAYLGGPAGASAASSMFNGLLGSGSSGTSLPTNIVGGLGNRAVPTFG